MLTRIITAIVSLAVFIGLIIAGKTIFSIGVGIIILCMIYETTTALTQSRHVKLSGYLTCVIMIIGQQMGNTEIAIVISIMFAMMFLIFLHGKVRYTELFSVQFMAMYVTIFMGYIAKMYTEMGITVMALVFIIAWGSDTAAYFCGTFCGKHKLIPKVSPKKTIEGSVGAVIVTAILCAVYLFVLDKIGYPLFKNVTIESYIRISVIGLVASAISQLGDLCASAIKRDAGIKDYGKIFPGHGGFMDRFDSVIYIAPVVYYLCSYII